eukprot:scaffold1804_cov263-Pinguiococcus_pyrenoidosus.AAC.6
MDTRKRQDHSAAVGLANLAITPLAVDVLLQHDLGHAAMLLGDAVQRSGMAQADCSLLHGQVLLGPARRLVSGAAPSFRDACKGRHLVRIMFLRMFAFSSAISSGRLVAADMRGLNGRECSDSRGCEPCRGMVFNLRRSIRQLPNQRLHSAVRRLTSTESDVHPRRRLAASPFVLRGTIPAGTRCSSHPTARKRPSRAAGHTACRRLPC